MLTGTVFILSISILFTLDSSNLNHQEKLLIYQYLTYQYLFLS